jgi:hypothetical protein
MHTYRLGGTNVGAELTTNIVVFLSMVNQFPSFAILILRFLSLRHFSYIDSMRMAPHVAFTVCHDFRSLTSDYSFIVNSHSSTGFVLGRDWHTYFAEVAKEQDVDMPLSELHANGYIFLLLRLLTLLISLTGQNDDSINATQAGDLAVVNDRDSQLAKESLRRLFVGPYDYRVFAAGARCYMINMYGWLF